MTAKQLLSVSNLAAISLVVISCGSTGPEPPKPGTPAFYWKAANDTYRLGDYLKANDNLGQVIKSDNEHAAQALPLALVLSSGFTQAYMDLAEAYDAGARANRANPTPFRRQANNFRSLAATSALQFAETFHQFRGVNKDQSITLAFDSPAGSPAEPQQLSRVTNGILVPEAELDLIQKGMLQRGVLLSVCLAAGAKEDPAKMRAMFKQVPVQIPREVFVMAMANTLYEESELFGPKKLDAPNRLKMMCAEALAAFETIPPSKQSKELAGKIQKTLKKLKLT